MVRAVLIIAAVLFGVTGIFAQPNPIEQRNAIMVSQLREGMAPLFKIVQGKELFDQAKVAAAFAKLAETSAKLPPLWPPNSKPVAPQAGYYSSLKIWTNKRDFDARLAKMIKDVDENRLRATSLEGLKTAFEVVNQNCDSCHEAYRVRRR